MFACRITHETTKEFRLHLVMSHTFEFDLTNANKLARALAKGRDQGFAQAFDLASILRYKASGRLLLRAEVHTGSSSSLRVIEPFYGRTSQYISLPFSDG